MFFREFEVTKQDGEVKSLVLEHLELQKQVFHFNEAFSELLLLGAPFALLTAVAFGYFLIRSPVIVENASTFTFCGILAFVFVFRFLSTFFVLSQVEGEEKIWKVMNY